MLKCNNYITPGFYFLCVKVLDQGFKDTQGRVPGKTSRLLVKHCAYLHSFLGDVSYLFIKSSKESVVQESF